MRTLVLLLACLISSILPARAQQTDPPDGTPITAAQVSGPDSARLSPGLREEIAKLAGNPLDRQQLREIAARIEAEQPRYVAALRITAEPGGARVVFVVARMRDQEREANVNTRYVVDYAKVTGVPSHAITAELRADLNALEGKPLDGEQADRLETRLKSVFPDYDVDRRMERGYKTGQVTLIFALTRNERTRWLRFEPSNSHAIYHSDQGWSWFADIPMGSRELKVTPYFALDSTENLLEEYSGLGVRIETRKLGTERLGAIIDWSWFDDDWRNSTLGALSLDPRIPGAYDSRTTFTPMVSFAATRHLRISGGVSIVELNPLQPVSFTGGSTMANAAVGSIGYSLKRRTESGARHDLQAALTVRSGVGWLQSDLRYTRTLGQVEYAFKSGRHQLLVSGMGGGISGSAPLFERFALGDARTLRGWDKYAISPAGGDRMIYSSLEYRYGVLALFVDSGSAWNSGEPVKFRVSTGVGIQSGPFFMTVGVPVNTSDLRAVFTAGLRFSGSTIKKY